MLISIGKFLERQEPAAKAAPKAAAPPPPPAPAPQPGKQAGDATAGTWEILPT
jgi:hypothetical protein